MITLKELLGDAYKDGMSMEEINTALESVSLPVDEASKKELEKAKKALDRSNSEAAEYKRKYQEKLTAEEKEKEEREKATQALQDELTALRKEKAISDSKSKLLALGYAEELALSSAQALVDGDMDKFYANEKAHISAVKSALTAELMKKVPTPPAGDPTDIMTLAKLKKMSPQERYEYSTKNPEEYKKLYNGGNE